MAEAMKSVPALSSSRTCEQCAMSLSIFSDRDGRNCRHCGKVFCGKCAKKKNIIPKFAIYEPVKVCDVCFDVLETSLARSSNSGDSSMGKTLHERMSSGGSLKHLRVPREIAIESFDLWITRLRSPDITPDELFNLQDILLSSTAEFRLSFVEGGGLAQLAMMLDGEFTDKTKLEALGCVRDFMDAHNDVVMVLETPFLLGNIVSCLSNNFELLRVQALEILTVVCWRSRDGRKSVIFLLSETARGAQIRPDDKGSKVTSLTTLVKSFTKTLKGSKNVNYQCNVMLLLNALILSGDSLESRVRMRNQLMNNGMGEALDALQEFLGDGLEFPELQSQVDIWENELQKDQRATTRAGIDLSDVNAVFEYLKETARQDGFGESFLAIMQVLLTIPSNSSVGERVWSNCQYILEQACISNSTKSEGNEVLSFTQLKHLLEEKEVVGLKDHADTIKDLLGKLEQQRAENLNYKAANTELLAKCKTLEELSKAHATEDPKRLDEETPISKASQQGEATNLSEVQRLQTALSLAEKRIEELQAALDKSNGRDAASEAPLAPDTPDAPSAPPLDAPDAPPSAPGLPDAPDAPPSAPGPPDGPPGPPDGPPGPPDGPAKVAVKAQPKPRVTMRKFHWQTLGALDTKNTIWVTIKDEDVKLDIDEFEQTFQEKKVAARGGDEKKAEPKDEKKLLVKLFDEKRSYNIDIALARIRMTFEHIRDSILLMDENALQHDKIVALQKIVPTAEEVEIISAYTDADDTLDNTGRFFKVLVPIPNIETRLKFFDFRQSFLGIFDTCTNDLNIVSNALIKIRDSKNLPIVLQLVLAFGNYMNASTPKGGAYGFKLSSLSRLKSTKTSDNKASLLTYLIRYIQRNYPNPSESPAQFLEDLSGCADASRVEAQHVMQEIAKLAANFKALEAELKTYTPINALDMFHSVMSDFVNTGTILFGDCTAALHDIENTYSSLLTYLGEPTLSMEWQEFFALWSDFAKDYKAEVANIEKRDKESRELAQKAQREAAKKEAAQKKALASAEKPQMSTSSSSASLAAPDDKPLTRDRKVSWSSQMISSLKSEQGVRQVQSNRAAEEPPLVLQNLSAATARLAAGNQLTPVKRGQAKEPVILPAGGCKTCTCTVFVKHKFSARCSKCGHVH